MSCLPTDSAPESQGYEKPIELSGQCDERLKIMSEITSQILAAKSPLEIAKVALEHLYQLVTYTQANVFEYDLMQDEIVILASHRDQYPLMLTGDRLPFRYFSLESTLFNESVIYVSNMSQIESPTTAQQLIYNVGVRSYISAPLIAQNVPIGALNIGADQIDAFSEDEVDTVREIADLLAVSLQQARLYQQVQSYARELEERVQERTAALQAANLQLERAVRLKDQFLANMSHELRTPLNAILAKSDTLLNGIFGTLNERQLRSAHTIRESGLHLLDLINSVLDLSKIEAEQMLLSKSRVSLQNLCEASLQSVKEIAHKKQIRLTSKIDSQSVELWADERRLRQILVNLLGNAIKFTPFDGQVGLDVTIDAEQKRVQFVVWDTGIGIAPNEQERLFQPFVQLDGGLTRQYGGTGLGLCLVQRLAELHEGHISLESEVGKGSRFTVSIPWGKQVVHLQRVDNIETKQAPPEQATHRRVSTRKSSHSHPSSSAMWREPTNKTRKTVLLAEDRPCNVDMIRDFLEYYGYYIVATQTGIEALSQTQRILPDLILIDLQMPDLDGIEVIHQIRHFEQCQDTPIIALASLATPEDQERSLAAGANEYVTKPILPSELLKRIKRYL